MSRHLAARLGKEGILVNAIAPGSFPSKMMAETLRKHGDEITARVPVGRIGSPEDIAGTFMSHVTLCLCSIIYQHLEGTCIYLASRAGNYTSGATIVVDGGAIQNNSRL